MPAAVELSNQRFGRLLAIKQLSERTASGGLVWLCRCDCGAEVTAGSNSLRTGATKSCGCLQIDAARTTGFKNATHGYTRTATYRSWSMMIQRCTNPNRDNYKYYGGRGVSVCERWMSFANFVSDLGERPSANHCLSRRNDRGDYGPGNTSWKLKSENIREMNSRRVVQ